VIENKAFLRERSCPPPDQFRLLRIFDHGYARRFTFHDVHAKLATYIPKTTTESFVLVKALPRVISEQGTAGTEFQVIRHEHRLWVTSSRMS
jgi:hypothetical protein